MDKCVVGAMVWADGHIGTSHLWLFLGSEIPSKEIWALTGGQGQAISWEAPNSTLNALLNSQELTVQ